MLSGSRHVASLARPDSLGIECEAEHSGWLCFDFVHKGGDPRGRDRACVYCCLRFVVFGFRNLGGRACVQIHRDLVTGS
jgi:hypothetical protein